MRFGPDDVIVGVDQSMNSTGVVAVPLSDPLSYETMKKYLITTEDKRAASDRPYMEIHQFRVVAFEIAVAIKLINADHKVSMVVLEQPAQGATGNASRLSSLLGAITTTLLTEFGCFPILLVANNSAKSMFFGTGIKKDTNYSLHFAARLEELRKRKLESVAWESNKSSPISSDLVDAFLLGYAGWKFVCRSCDPKVRKLLGSRNRLMGAPLNLVSEAAKVVKRREVTWGHADRS